MADFTTNDNGSPLTVLNVDGLGDCGLCEMPLTPVDIDDAYVHLECANRHRAMAALPESRAMRLVVGSWIARRGAQMSFQRDRRAAEKAEDEGQGL